VEEGEGEEGGEGGEGALTIILRTNLGRAGSEP
jgi:hypothetical protein